MYQLSNQMTLGLRAGGDRRLEEVVRSTIEREKSLETTLWRKIPVSGGPDLRAYGMLSNARHISNGEAMRLISDIRMGVSTGILKGIPISELKAAMVYPDKLYHQRGGRAAHRT